MIFEIAVGVMLGVIFLLIIGASVFILWVFADTIREKAKRKKRNPYPFIYEELEEELGRKVAEIIGEDVRR